MTEPQNQQLSSTAAERHVVDGSGAPPLPPARDPLRDEHWFAAQIGKSAQWCRKNRRELPHHVVGESVRYDDHCVDLYRSQTFRPATTQDPGHVAALRPLDQMVPSPLSARRTRVSRRATG